MLALAGQTICRQRSRPRRAHRQALPRAARAVAESLPAGRRRALGQPCSPCAATSLRSRQQSGTAWECSQRAPAARLRFSAGVLTTKLAPERVLALPASVRSRSPTKRPCLKQSSRVALPSVRTPGSRSTPECPSAAACRAASISALRVLRRGAIVAAGLGEGGDADLALDIGKSGDRAVAVTSPSGSARLSGSAKTSRAASRGPVARYAARSTAWRSWRTLPPRSLRDQSQLLIGNLARRQWPGLLAQEAAPGWECPTDAYAAAG